MRAEQRYQKSHSVEETMEISSSQSKDLDEQYKYSGEIPENPLSIIKYFGGARKSLQIVTAVMKLKDACSLEEKLWPTYYADHTSAY